MPEDIKTTKQGKEIKSHVEKISLKEDKDGEFYSEGFIATSHKDRVGDILSVNALKKISDSINDKFNPMADAVSYRHDWVKQDNPDLPLAGIATHAEIKKTDDGQMGVFVRTHHNKMHPEFDKTKYEVENGYLAGYSIEFELPDNGFKTVNLEGNPTRVIDDLNFVGYGFADARMIANPHAQITNYGYKEIVSMEACPKCAEKKENVVDDVHIENKEESKKTSIKEESKMVEEKPVETKEVKDKTFSVSETEYLMIKEIQERQKNEKSNKEIKEMIDSVMKEKMPLVNPKVETKTELKEITQYKEALAKSDELLKPMSNDMRASLQKNIVKEQYKNAARLLNKCIELGVPIAQNSRESELNGITPSCKMMEDSWGNVKVKELGRIELKAGEGLQFDTNMHSSWTYGSYYLSPTEYNDIFQPVLINQLNDQATTWGKLQKKDFSGYSSIEVRARTGRNSTAGGYSEGANLTYASSFTGYTTRLKILQPFAYYRVLVAVTGQAIQFSKSPGGIGDLWAREVEDAGTDLAKKLNQEIIKGGGDGTAESLCLDFEHIMLGLTGTLYGRDISVDTTLKSTKSNMSSAAITLGKLRDMIREVMGGGTLTNANAKQGDIVFFTSYLQKNMILSLIQSMQRIVPTSSRVGFEGVPEFDGVPIFADADYNTDDIYLIDTSAMYIAMNLPPTLELLPVTADAKAAHIKTYFNLFCEKPSNCYWAYGAATS